jgi:hypothetical protein
MKTRIPSLATLVLALAAAGLARAQAPNPPPPEMPADLQLQLAQLEVEQQAFVDSMNDGFAFAAGEMRSERVVKGAPYCAEAVHETVQWLPDGSGGAGNRIVRQQSTQLCRDGEGRTRQEVQRGSRKLVYLRDPVAQEVWVLDPERKTARQLGVPRNMSSIDRAAWRDYGERMREWARGVAERARSSGPNPNPNPNPNPSPSPNPHPVPPVPPVAAVAPVAPVAPPMPVVITRGDVNGKEVDVRVMRLRGNGDEDWAMAPPAVQTRAMSWAPRGSGAVSPLPGRDIEGVRANGERTTWVIEAGKVGNEKPIQIVREVWTAPDLMVTISSRDFDPRSGEVNYRLKGIKRGEPDAALMKVPADYKQPGRPGSKASAPTG